MTADDPLEGWDADAADGELDAWLHDRAPFPADLAAVAGAAAAGALVGALASQRRGRGALLAGLLGAVVAGVGRRVWRLR